MNLSEILLCFDSPIKEEQAWAVCHQCGKFLKQLTNQNERNKYASPSGPKSILFDKDGCVSISGNPSVDEVEVLKNLGLTVFAALDYGLSSDEEQLISNDLENMISWMTGEVAGSDDEADEGYDDFKEQTDAAAIDQMIMLCEQHLSIRNDTDSHYLAVCRALVTEALELQVFLSKIASANESLQKLTKTIPSSTEEKPDSPTEGVTSLNFVEWAHMWMQVLDELRHGVTRLRKVERQAKILVEYELTPYEILMEDIRQRKYTLKKVVPNKQLPAEVKKSAHDIILEFIRSRPSLSPAHERVLAPTPPRSKSLHERLIEQIHENSVSLKHVEMKTSRSFTFDGSSRFGSEISSTPTNPRRRLPKPPSMQDLTLEDYDTTECDTEIEDDSLAVCFDEDSDSVRLSSMPSTNGSLNGSSLLSSDITGLSTPSSLNSSPRHRPLSMRFSDSIRRKRLLPLELPPSPIQTPESKPPERKSSFISSLFSFRPPNGLQRSQSLAIRSTRPGLDSASLKRDRWLNRKERAVEVEDKREWNYTLPPPLHDPVQPPPLRRTFSDRRRSAQEKWSNPAESLTLTVEEVMHIREVLSRAQMEKFQNCKEIYNGLKEEKICFNCRVRKFNLFFWPHTCQICKRKICAKCITKISAPTEKYLKTPLYSLSPNLVSSRSGLSSFKDSKLKYRTSGSISPGNILQQQYRREQSSESITSLMWSRGKKLDVCLECHMLISGVVETNREAALEVE